jgi:hypothetical protein
MNAMQPQYLQATVTGFQLGSVGHFCLMTLPSSSSIREDLRNQQAAYVLMLSCISSHAGFEDMGILVQDSCPVSALQNYM